MNEIEVVITCPFGNSCEEAKEGKIYRCALYTKISGTDPQNVKKFIEEWKCAIAWGPILAVENAKESRSVRSTVQEFRNDLASSFKHLAERQQELSA